MVTLTQIVPLLLLLLSNSHADFPLIANYEPMSSVTDHANIDQDLQSIMSQLSKYSYQSFLAATKIYQEGGHSKSYAILTLDDSLAGGLNIMNSTLLNGEDINGRTVWGSAMEDMSDGKVKFQYKDNAEVALSGYEDCRVGGLPENDYVYDGCLNEEAIITVTSKNQAEVELAYSYNINSDNRNKRTIAGFSTGIESKMLKDCKGCPFEIFEAYNDYYGQPDYADAWVLHALNGTDLVYDNDRNEGNAKFSEFGMIGREECAKKGMAYMNVWMYVIRELEDAISDCDSKCINCNDDPVHAWDEGVAFYTGSLHGQDAEPNSGGNLLYTLADKRCINFNTCGPTGNQTSGTAQVNTKIFTEFAVGQDLLLRGKCERAKVSKNKIINLMSIPLVQGTLRYAYKVNRRQTYVIDEDEENPDQLEEKEKAEGAVFAASIIPRVHKCDKADADIIYDNMRVGANSTDFKAVKKAFENNYKCLGMTCQEVGGLMLGNGYYLGAEPCKDKKGMSGTAITIAIGFILVVGITFFFGLMCILMRRKKRGLPLFKRSSGTTS